MLKKLLLAIVVLCAGIQLIRPHRNISAAPPGPNDVTVRFPPPPDVEHSLQVACYDCHSNNTRYPWYANVQPVGWWLASHINDGKRRLNFSIMGSYPKKRVARLFDAISDRVSDHSMPLASYRLIHHDARLTNQQIQAITDWADGWNDKLDPQDN